MMRHPDVLVVVGMLREAQIATALGRTRVGTVGLAGAGYGAILSFGLCGALDPALKVGHLLVADSVVGSGDMHIPTDARWTAALREALPDARRGDMAGGDVIVATPADKAALFRATGAVAVDMESHAVAKAAADAGIPFAVVRVVSDDAARSLPRAAQAGFSAGGEPDIGAVIRALARRPWELPALIQVAFEAEAGFKALTRAASRLAGP